MRLSEYRGRSDMSCIKSITGRQLSEESPFAMQTDSLIPTYPANQQWAGKFDCHAYKPASRTLKKECSQASQPILPRGRIFC